MKGINGRIACFLLGHEKMTEKEIDGFRVKLPELIRFETPYAEATSVGIDKGEAVSEILQYNMVGEVCVCKRCGCLYMDFRSKVVTNPHNAGQAVDPAHKYT